MKWPCAVFVAWSSSLIYLCTEMEDWILAYDYPNYFRKFVLFRLLRDKTVLWDHHAAFVCTWERKTDCMSVCVLSLNFLTTGPIFANLFSVIMSLQNILFAYVYLPKLLMAVRSALKLWTGSQNKTIIFGVLKEYIEIDLEQYASFVKVIMF